MTPDFAALHPGYRHCERSEAIQCAASGGMDCFVAEFIIGRAEGGTRWLLAMTAKAIYFAAALGAAPAPDWVASSFLRVSSARFCSSSCSFFWVSSNTFGSVGGPS